MIIETNLKIFTKALHILTSVTAEGLLAATAREVRGETVMGTSRAGAGAGAGAPSHSPPPPPPRAVTSRDTVFRDFFLLSTMTGVTILTTDTGKVQWC